MPQHKTALLGLFSIFIFCFSHNINATCKTHLSTEQIQSKYPLALGLAFDDAYKSHYGDGSKRLKEIFEFLGIGGATRPSLVLQTVLSHLNEKPSFVDRFYPLNLDSNKKELFSSTLKALDQRIKLLNDYLAQNPLKGSDSGKKLSELFANLLSDFKLNSGFKALSETDILQHLQATRDTSYTVDSDFVVFRNENAIIVKDKIKKINPLSFRTINQKPYFDTFEDFLILKTMHFYILHSATLSPKDLFDNYIKGVEFVLNVIINPTQEFQVADMKPAAVSDFFFSMNELLGVKGKQRFGESAITHFGAQIKTHLEDLRYHLSIATPSALFPAASSFIGLNQCLKNVGLEQLEYPTRN